MVKNAEKKTQEVVATQDTETALTAAAPAGGLAVQPSIDELMEAAAGVGGQDAKASDMAIPFLGIIQKGSPQIDDTNGKFIPGAKQGYVFNTVTNSVYDTRTGVVKFVEVATQKRFVEWVPRDQGGGFVGQHAPESEIVANSFVDEKNKRFVKRGGNSLVETAYHFVLVLNEEGGYEPAVIGLSSTQLKFSRRLNYVIQTKTVKNKAGVAIAAPRFGFVYSAKTKPEENAFGSWFAWDLVGTGDKVTNLDLLQAAIAMRKQFDSGAIQTAAPPQQEEASAAPPQQEEASGGGNAAGSGNGGSGEDVPF